MALLNAYNVNPTVAVFVMSNFRGVIDVVADGVVVVGEAPSGSVNITLEGGTSGTIGYIKLPNGGFFAFADGALTTNGSLVVDCGVGAELAVTVAGAPCRVVSRPLGNA